LPNEHIARKGSSLGLRSSFVAGIGEGKTAPFGRIEWQNFFREEIATDFEKSSP
jgi:hypothetical protein